MSSSPDDAIRPALCGYEPGAVSVCAMDEQQLNIGQHAVPTEERRPDGYGDEEDEDTGAVAQQLAHSLYPAPPLAFRRFTRDNVARLKVLQATHLDDQTTGAFDWSHAKPDARMARQQDALQAEVDRRRKAKARHSDDEGFEGGVGDSKMQDGMNGGIDAETKEMKAHRRSVNLTPPPTWDVLLTMAPPNVDWIEEDGHYTCFGEQWPVHEALPTLEEMGMPQIYPHAQTADASADNTGVHEQQPDRPAILATLLRTMLKSYLELVDVVLAPPQEYLAEEVDPSTGQKFHGEWRFTSQDKAREINDVSINFMHLLNETRPLQAREQLRDLMRQQLHRRREEAALMRSQCTAIRQEIERLCERMQREAETVALRNRVVSEA